MTLPFAFCPEGLTLTAITFAVYTGAALFMCCHTILWSMNTIYYNKAAKKQVANQQVANQVV